MVINIANSPHSNPKGSEAMKYFDEDGVMYNVGTAGVSKEGTHYCVETYDERTEGVNVVVSINPSVNKLEIETALAEYAKENGLMPDVIYKIKTGDRILQGEVIQSRDFIKLAAEEVSKEALSYFDREAEIEAVRAKLKHDIDNLKKVAEEEIEGIAELMDAHRQAATTGIRPVDCESSWERDLENGVMLLVRHDNLKVLQWRKMTELEAQVQTTDPEAQG
jgi:hypothetical protein